jgi:hypothetical protein
MRNSALRDQIKAAHQNKTDYPLWVITPAGIFNGILVGDITGWAAEQAKESRGDFRALQAASFPDAQPKNVKPREFDDFLMKAVTWGETCKSIAESLPWAIISIEAVVAWGIII